MLTLSLGTQKKEALQASVVFIGSKSGLKSLSNFAELFKSTQKEKSFTAAKGEILFFRQPAAEQSILFVGLGDKPDLETLRRAAGQVVKVLRQQKMENAEIHLSALSELFKNQQEFTQTLCEGLLLAGYRFDQLKLPKPKLQPELKLIVLNPAGKINLGAAKQGLKDATILAESINLAKSLGDLPGNLMTPTLLAETAKKEAKGTGLKVTVWDESRIKKEKMELFLSVSAGSDQPAKFIIMEYKGTASSKAPICFVGKGLTFDAGGISIKPSAGMEEMKYDMCGGANVIGTMLAIARLKLKVNVIGLVPTSENLPGPSANKPGDIHYARNGKSVEINNTDAEGRLILADALVYACEQKPAWICDIATLTGAMKVALGDTHTGYFCQSSSLRKVIQSAADRSGEWVWELPLCDDHGKDMKGVYADLLNVPNSNNGAGSAKGAAFLKEFVDKDIPWAHFDIAATAWHTGHRISYHPDRGATGVMIRTFVEMAKAQK